MKRRSFMGVCLPCSLAFSATKPPVDLFPFFTDVASGSQIDFRCHSSSTSQKYLIETMLGGVAMFDYDQDGYLDLFFVNGAALKDPMLSGDEPDKSDPKFWNRLYRNNRDGTFTDVTERAGVRGHSYGQGVAVGDYNNDGFPDLYVTNYGSNILYRNNGDGTFTDVTEQAGVAAHGWSTGACFVDYDRDGRLDLIVARYLDWDLHKNPWCGDPTRHLRAYCHPEVFRPATYVVYHNNGDGTFSDVTAQAGFVQHPGNGLGIDINDFDGDGWPDVVVANDTLPQQLFRNNHDGTFSEIGTRSGLAFDQDGKAYSGMGLSFEDYDNDGRPDVFIGNLATQQYALYRNLGDGTVDYVTNQCNVGAISKLHSAWGVKFVDIDNDGWKDLLIAQSHVMDNIQLTQPELRYKEPLLLLRNLGGKKFEDVSSEAGPPFRLPMVARGAAFGDFNNDGFVDCAINRLDGPALLLRNHGNSNRWLIIDTVGTRSNRDGIGTRIHLATASGRHQYAMVSTCGSYLSAGDKRVHFGLGTEMHVPMIELFWPSGIVQRLEHVPTNQILRVRESSLSK